MKKIYLLILIVFTSTILTAQEITEGIITYWPLDGDGVDQSGNGLDGTIYGPLSSEDRFNTPEKALSFDGIDDYIQFGDLPANMFSNDFTISVWLKPNSLSGNNFIIDKRIADNSGLVFMLDNNSLRLSLNSFDSFSTAGEYQLTSGVWVHCLVLRLNGEIKFYLNGQMFTNTYNSLEDASNTQAFKVGTRAFNTPAHSFDGAMDDMMIFARALTENEISILYDDSPKELCSSIFCDGGNVGIGTAYTRGYKFAVAGKAIAEEIKVALVENWPDFVFENNYELRTLEEVENYISANKHLPEIPSEKEVIDNGINLGKMDAKLLQKIEELTLYMIEQSKQNQAQQARIERLEKELNNLKNE